jgi:hypothetical protein
MAGVIFDGKTVAPAILVEKEIEKTKFGATVDTWIGDIDENGVLHKTSWRGDLNFAGVKKIPYSGLEYAFWYCKSITGVYLSSLEDVESYGLQYSFRDCYAVENIDLSSLKTVGTYGMQYAFYYCSALKIALDLSSLESIGDNGLRYAFAYSAITSLDLSSLKTVDKEGLNYAFYNCDRIVNVDLSSLETTGSRCMLYTFRNCTGITTISFPSLINVQADSFASTSSNGAFMGCTALTEIHFRADMQATIEAMTQYANKWGATNASIIFDL